jgi:glycogen synthase
MIRAMSQDWSWRKSAGKYMELYLNMCGRQNPVDLG